MGWSGIRICNFSIRRAVINRNKYQWISIPKKMGYEAITDLIIVDQNNKPFYVTKRGQKFNMPAGKFGVMGMMKGMTKPIDYELPIIYAIERSDREFKKVICDYVKNPNKASVAFVAGTARIFLDEQFKEYPLACTLYLIAHECAHSKYNGEGDELENKCDAYAEHTLIDLGLNPSQIKQCNEMLLRSGWRKKQCEKRMEKHFSK